MKMKKQLKMTKNKLYYILTALILSIVFSSCSDFLDVEPEEVLLPENHFQNKYDADAAIIGIYGKFMELAPQYVILNELRADLMDVTENSDNYLKQVNEHKVVAGNPYADPVPFYAIINNCNDAISNFQIMLDNLKLSRDEYNQRYSDIVTLRSWLYLQLAIHFGDVPYITEPITSIDDVLKVDNQKYPILSIPEMVKKLIEEMSSLPYFGSYTETTLMTNIDGFNTQIMFINKVLFLGDLFLWDNDYLNAAIAYKSVVDSPNSINANARYDRYKLYWGAYLAGFERYYENDYNSRYNNWVLMFRDGQTTAFYNEWLWVMHYHDFYGEVNPFIDLFQTGYKLKPSESAINNWNSQVFSNGFYGDFRGDEGTFAMEGDRAVIKKYTYNYNPLLPSNKEGKWFLYRTAGLHLRYSEAVNRSKHTKIAYSLVNDGIAANYLGPESAKLDGDITYEQKTLLEFPYDWDAAMSTTSQIPYSRGTHHRNRGVRSRVSLAKNEYPSASDSIQIMEDQIIDEASLELAYEGQRWPDLVRIALRRNDPSFLANKVYQKHLAAGNPNAEAIRDKLMDQANWFLPLNKN